MLLYDYFRSSAAFRVRIALALKGLSTERRFIHLQADGGMQHSEDYRRKNPQGLVPALELDNGVVLTQSLAIIEYLDALQPSPRIVPLQPLLAAQTRAAALTIACDTHPLGNLRVLFYLKNELGLDAEALAAWRTHWVLDGLRAIERLIDPGPFCFGAEPTIADICLAPSSSTRRASQFRSKNSQRCAPPVPPAMRIRRFAPRIPPRSPTPNRRRLETFRRRQI